MQLDAVHREVLEEREKLEEVRKQYRAKVQQQRELEEFLKPLEEQKENLARLTADVAQQMNSQRERKERLEAGEAELERLEKNQGEQLRQRKAQHVSKMNAMKAELDFMDSSEKQLATQLAELQKAVAARQQKVEGYAALFAETYQEKKMSGGTPGALDMGIARLSVFAYFLFDVSGNNCSRSLWINKHRHRACIFLICSLVARKILLYLCERSSIFSM